MPMPPFACRRHAGAVTIVLIAVVALASACQNEALPVEPRADEDHDDRKLIGGFAANDARLDAIGAMVAILPGGINEELCGAALVAPETVVTAKHCAVIIPAALQAGFKVGYVTGANVIAPKSIVEIADFALAPGNEGGFVGMGNDVAVLHLEHPIAAIAPLQLGSLTDAEVATPFAAIGYGVQDILFSAGTRRLGRQTLRGLHGRAFELLFGTFPRFVEYLQTGDVASDDLGTAVLADGTGGTSGGTGGRGGGPEVDAGASDGGKGPPSLEEYARALWDASFLLDGYEAVTGGFPGDVQPCYGDSGSPLIRQQSGQFISYGVVSGGLASNRSPCDFGAVYATFGPAVREFIEAAKAWVDPCGRVDTHGVCDGNVARRCTDPIEGRRRITEFDCELLGMTCDTRGGATRDQVSCDGMPIAPPRPRPTPTPSDVRAIKEMIARAFTAGSRKL